jgi:hypothetical protein
MKKTKQHIDPEFVKDDELIRIQAIEDGEKKVGNWTFRPMTALTVSWMQRNNVFGENRDMIWKAGAFAFLHSETFAKIREVVNDTDEFTDAVDCWIEENITGGPAMIAKLSKAMNDAFEYYMAADTISTGSSTKN